VLFAQEQRNILMTLAVENLFRLHWTDEIEDEWIRNRREHLLKKGLDTDAPARTAAKMRKANPDFDPGDWQPFVGKTGRTDPRDRHVAAAAIACAPSYLLTWNIGDFDIEHLANHRVVVRNPDEFLCEIYDDDPVVTFEASRKAHSFARAAAGLTPLWIEYVGRLSASRLAEFSARLRSHDPDDTLAGLPAVLSDRESNDD
jgi:hypothetical protein